MELIEVTEKQRLGREEIARRLRDLADQLSRHNEIAFDRGGVHFRARVPDELDFEFEFEMKDDGAEVEIELSW